jgi:hypothetical protein
MLLELLFSLVSRIRSTALRKHGLDDYLAC